MYTTCVKWIQSCAICQKYGLSCVHAKLNPLVTDMPFQIVAVDFVGPLQVDEAGHKYIFPMEDVQTRYAKFHAVNTADAQTAVQSICTKWFSRWGVPLVLLADAGPVFRSKLWMQMCKEQSITSLIAPPYFERANGPNERMTQPILQLLRKELTAKRGMWSLHLDHMTQVYRNLPHETMACSPNQPVLGIHLRLPGQPAHSSFVPPTPQMLQVMTLTSNQAHSSITSHYERH